MQKILAAADKRQGALATKARLALHNGKAMTLLSRRQLYSTTSAIASDHSHTAPTTYTFTRDCLRQSQNDKKRQYAHLKLLTNNLEAILVSDPDTTDAAAAMDVSVGYFHDPKVRYHIHQRLYYTTLILILYFLNIFYVGFCTFFIYYVVFS